MIPLENRAYEELDGHRVGPSITISAYSTHVNGMAEPYSRTASGDGGGNVIPLENKAYEELDGDRVFSDYQGLYADVQEST